ncbi:putative haloacid dehalogenase-like hydrolase [Catellatospora sp. TT07R-123]|uniref:HAD family hydrolase n=1 Tax=Catellatospora sp. TT07R-123 TaxID=2733863 RepID=UPI001B084E3D|nr:HAD family hydrolase [Catellatospora sp. TT07R-123]GHJ47229.1 putative haloacid dehalogenase-like hydrolase [Catellatospora sp. TT07R-123]
MSFETVVLDLAGTTVADDGLVEEAFTRAFDRVRPGDPDRSASLDYVRATMGQSKIEVFRALGDEATAQRLNIAFEQAYAELVGQGRCEPIPGAVEAVGELRRRGLAVVFTTGFGRATADAVIDALGWQQLADAVLTPAEAGRGRPAPDLALMALLRTGASSVGSLVVVGDTESDAACGVAAGAGLVVGVLTGGRSESALRAAGAHEVISSVVELPALIDARV